MNTMRKLAYCFLTLHVFLLLTACQNKTETTTFSSEGVTVEVPVDWRFNKFEEDGIYAPKEFTWNIGEFSLFGIYVYDKRKMEHFDDVTLEWFYNRVALPSMSETYVDTPPRETKNTLSIAGMQGIHSAITTNFLGELTSNITIFKKESPNIRAFILFYRMSESDPDVSALVESVLTSVSITE